MNHAHGRTIPHKYAAPLTGPVPKRSAESTLESIHPESHNYTHGVRRFAKTHECCFDSNSLQEYRNQQRARSEASPRMHAAQPASNTAGAGDMNMASDRPRTAPRPTESSARSEPSLRNSTTVGRGPGPASTRPETTVSNSQEEWPFLDAAAPFTVPAAPASVPRSGDGGFQWLGGVQVPTAPSETSVSHARASCSFAAVRSFSLLSQLYDVPVCLLHREAVCFSCTPLAFIHVTLIQRHLLL